jgi:hypothetical protein
VLVGLLASNVYRESQVFLNLSIDSRVLTFTITVAMVTGLLFGLAPALRAMRVDLQLAMKANARGVARRSNFAPAKALIVIQVALSLVLVVSAGLLLATFVRLEMLDPGFERAHVLLMDVDLGESTVSPARRFSIYKGVLEHLRALPAVHFASHSADTPLGGSVNASYLQIEGDTSPREGRELVFGNEVSDQYFETLGIRLLAGRDFNVHDAANSPRVAVVNESFAKNICMVKIPSAGATARSEAASSATLSKSLAWCATLNSSICERTFIRRSTSPPVRIRIQAKWSPLSCAPPAEMRQPSCPRRNAQSTRSTLTLGCNLGHSPNRSTIR